MLTVLIAMLLVVVITSLLLRSLGNGLLAIIPIAITLILLFGAMGITGIPLDIAG